MRTARALWSLIAALAVAAAGAAPAGAQVPEACLGDGPRAVACIVNEGRAAKGLRRLRRDAILARAAQAYADRMVREGFFSHRDPQGEGPLDRLVDAGYGKRKRGRRWRAGEVLGLEAGPWASPQGVVLHWFASPPHRRVLLDRGFRDVGVGIATEPPALGGLPVRRYVLYAGRR